MQRYPYDDILFEPGKHCPTCLFVKPARSKHCSICNACISKHDHHCVWLKNCVGLANYAYFLGLLGSLGVLLTYGSVLSYSLLSMTMWADRDETPPASLHERVLDHTNELGAAVAQDPRIGAIGLLCFLTCPLAWGMLFYHCYLLWAGMTTNESSKWASWRDDIKDGYVVKRERPVAEMHRQWSSAVFQEPSLAFKRVPDEDVSTSEWMQHHVRLGWTQVLSLDEMQNIYDLGFKQNLIRSLKGV